ncbi:MAG: sortase [Candidatus Dojkabacteria bacterium]|nr:MAG: sortase [Candidatus Dojkabacteria bacterium]
MRYDTWFHKIVQGLALGFPLFLFALVLFGFRMEIIGAVQAVFSFPSPKEAYSSVLEEVFPEPPTMLSLQNNDNSDSSSIFEGEVEQFVTEEPHYYSISEHDSRLIIPSANIDGPVVGGTTDKSMNKGFWHYPTSAASFQYGNTVLIGHRYLKVPPHKDTFYNLDKVNPGDEIMIRTPDGIITYVVTEKKVIEKTYVEILEHSADPQLTLITCHPLWTSRQRLVIMARLVSTTIKL